MHEHNKKNEKWKDLVAIEVAINNALLVFPDLLDSVASEKVSRGEKVAVVIIQLTENLIDSMADRALQDEQNAHLKKEIALLNQLVKVMQDTLTTYKGIFRDTMPKEKYDEFFGTIEDVNTEYEK